MPMPVDRMPTTLRSPSAEAMALRRTINELRASRPVQYVLGSSGSTPIAAQSFTADSTVRAGFFKTTSATAHAVTIYQAGTSGVDVAAALNVVSDNPQTSSMFLSGTETNRGTLKVAHHGYSDGSDASAAGISIDVQTTQGGTSGTAAQGLFVTSTTDTIPTGNAITVRYNAQDWFVVKGGVGTAGAGIVGIGIATGHTPAGMLEIAQKDTATVGLAMTAISGGQQLVLLKDSGGNSRFEINAAGNSIHRATSFFTTSVQVGSASADLGGGAGVISIKNATTNPTTNPTGGGILYTSGGALLYRGSSGSVTTIALA